MLELEMPVGVKLLGSAQVCGMTMGVSGSGEVGAGVISQH